MKKFVLLHVGFENPTEEVMSEWNKWFETIAEFQGEGDNIGFGTGKEVTSETVNDLAWDVNALTGISIIEVESMEKAIELAKECPAITSVRVYELRQG